MLSRSPLYDAIKSQDLVEIKRILVRQDFFDEWDDGVIGFAVSTGNRNIIDILVGYGYTLDHDCFLGNTSPLGMAIEENLPIDFILYLITKGADPKKRLDVIPVLTLAVRRGDLEIVRILINAGVSVNDRDESGYTSIMEAIFKKDTDMVDLLIANGADLNVLTLYGESVLSLALEEKNRALTAVSIAKYDAIINLLQAHL
jgi:ankyrin repeat protein